MRFLDSRGPTSVESEALETFGERLEKIFRAKVGQAGNAAVTVELADLQEAFAQTQSELRSKQRNVA